MCARVVSLSGLPLLLGLALLLPPPVAAQDAPGSWVEVGLAPAWSGLSCPVCTTDRTRGGEVRVGVGRTFRPSLRLGAEVSGWTSLGEEVRQLQGTTGLVAVVRPGAGPLVLRVGAGTGHYRALDPGDGTDVSYLGASFQLGVGLQTRVRERLTLTPQVGYAGSAFGPLKRGDQVLWERAGLHLLRTGISVTRH
jgi:hypothetical protein